MLNCNGCLWFVFFFFSGNVEDIPVETRESLMAKTASLPRNIPQWPTLQAGSIVSDYLTNLDIVSLHILLFCSFYSLSACHVFCCVVVVVVVCRRCLRVPRR